MIWNDCHAFFFMVFVFMVGLLLGQPSGLMMTKILVKLCPHRKVEEARTRRIRILDKRVYNCL